VSGLDIGIMVAKLAVLLIVHLSATAYMTLYERKLAGFIQRRLGPNRVGPWGLLQPLADGAKLIFKEEIYPTAANTTLYVLAPIITISLALAAFAVIPFSPDFTIGGVAITGYLADVNIGILYVVAISSLAVYGVVLGGWASNNKYSLLGGMRSSAQMISYEISMGLAIIVVIMMTGSASLVSIVEKQTLWNIFVFPHGPIAFFIFFLSYLAELNRAPFDFPEAEQELVAGYHTEYSSMKFGSYFVGEYGNIVTASAVMATLFFGGYQPIIPALSFIPGPLWLVAKTFIFCGVIIWIRWTLPRYRYDQLMELGWKVLIPLGLVNILIAGGLILLGGNYFG
jgi:NADH-quinone oxidoreductase subunit H